MYWKFLKYTKQTRKSRSGWPEICGMKESFRIWSLRMRTAAIFLSLQSGKHFRRHWKMPDLITIVYTIAATLLQSILFARGTISRRFRKTWGIIPQRLPWIAMAMSRRRCVRRAQTGCRPSFRECPETREEIHKWVRYGWFMGGQKEKPLYFHSNGFIVISDDWYFMLHAYTTYKRFWR